MTKRTKVVLIVAAAIVLFMGAMVCFAVLAVRNPAPASTTGPMEPMEQEDCDAEDQAKGQWWEGCTLNIRPTTGKPVAPKTPRPATTTKRRP